MMELHRRGIVTIDEIHDLARAKLGDDPSETTGDPNQAERDRTQQAKPADTAQAPQDHVCSASVIAAMTANFTQRPLEAPALGRLLQHVVEATGQLGALGLGIHFLYTTPTPPIPTACCP